MSIVTSRVLATAQAQLYQSVAGGQQEIADGADQRARDKKARALEAQVEAAEDRSDAALAGALVSIGVSVATTALNLLTAGTTSPATTAVEAAKQGVDLTAAQLAKNAANAAFDKCLALGARATIDLAGAAGREVPKYLLEKSAAGNDIQVARAQADAERITRRRDEAEKRADEQRQSAQRQMDAVVEQAVRLAEVTRYA